MWWIVWLILAVVLLVVELIAVDLVSIWFSLSAFIIGLVTALFPELHWGWQIFIFAVLATGLLVATRPLAKRFLKRKKGQETNLELVVDHIGIVEEDINNDLAVGLVKINGLVWSARSKNGDVISKKSFVIVKEINGNKLIVEKRKEKEE